MDCDIKYKPSYSMLVVKLEPNESITAEAGAMTYMDSNIDVQTRKREKSLLGTIGLKVLGRARAPTYPLFLVISAHIWFIADLLLPKKIDKPRTSISKR